MKRGLSVVQKKVIQEMVMQDVTKKTNAEIAEEYGINERTIYRWKNDVEFVEELNKQNSLSLQAFNYEATNQLKRLVRHGNSEQAMINAIKLVMQSNGMLKEQDVQVNVNNNIKQDGVSDELFADLDAILKG
ncbi:MULTISPECIES: phBC6A51 family helix-turn-helix protein [Bacillus cereus group]|uniref:phBC6A51 family helix-turn-helix protein n=1 Tax=Bacillus cereus group TaxID=86661 RepID=UPI00119DA831|nr:MULTISPECIES: phBC6A51 family helix-turn-helix protein [Bacillus cereus group]MDF9638812.1 phBC6A51 family helix-turn-helix protein [Bacillus cereus]